MAATGFQFAHIQWSSKERAAKVQQRKFLKGSHGTQRATGWSASDILAEAARKEGHCGHVANPLPPTLVYGIPLDQVEAKAATWSASRTVAVKLKNGAVIDRKRPSNMPILASGVISLPRDRMDEWPAYRDHAIEELKKKHGDRFLSAVEHLDENHPHFHFYLVPLIGEDFGAVHDGYAASRAARSEPDNKIRTAFQNAMRGWQDWIQEAIAAPFGLARIGPARARLKHNEWKESERLRAIAVQEQQVNEREKQAEARELVLVAREIALVSDSMRLQKLVADIERREALIVKKQDALDKTHAERTSILANRLDVQEKAQKQLDRLLQENAKSAEELRTVFGTFTLLQQQAVQTHSPKILDILQIKSTKSSDLGL